MPTVELRNVHKAYGKVQAVDGISFECKDKEFLVILGPSGAGKTSTLKMIAGLESVTQGDILVDGRRINFVPPEQRNVAMVFETYALYPHFTVYENMAFPLRSKHRRLTANEIKVRVTEVAELLQMGPLLKRSPSELSGGQKQRVSLGRALVRRADVLLMDEPLSHLDAKLRHHMRRELKKSQRILNTTTVYVTHDYLEALALADRIVILNEGRIHQVGTPSTVYDQPADIFAASLLGQPRINMLSCRIREGANGHTMLAPEDDSFRISCPPAFAHRSPQGGGVMLGVRPQHLRLTDNLDNGGIAGEVYVSEKLGVKCMVEVKVGSQILTVLTDAQTYSIGNPVKIEIPEEHMMLFDAQSGKNLMLES
jgi:multiple sugar transport system ATP-binding protein